MAATLTLWKMLSSVCLLPIPLAFHCSMWSELLMTSAISCPLWSSVYECQRVECAFTSPVRTEYGMFVMYCMQCCISVSTAWMCCLEEVYECLQL